MGYQKIVHPYPKTSVQQKIKNFQLGKSYRKFKRFGLWGIRKIFKKKTFNPYGGSKPTFNDTNRKSSSTQRQLCKKISKKFYGEKVICKSRFLGQWGYPWEFFSKFAQTYSLTSRAFWLKKPCCARMSKGSKPPRKISFRLLLPQKNFK